MLPIEELEALLAARIATIDPTPFRQGGLAESFSQSEHPYDDSGEEEGAGLRHLLFTVQAIESNDTGADDSLDSVKARTRVAVVFFYRLRASSQLVDSRLAARAARAVAGRLLRWHGDGVVDLAPALLWRPLLSDDAQWLGVRLEFVATHDVPFTSES